ncbi:HAD family hydrolase [Herbiconiux sp. CPCC 205763]|uniref:HAD family hydrolase n=1 Tax=Herbiconiux aconitum TaxID=2970913 RepID=A0ABT2GP69_9MICO|nr:HAD family hydrolase [Herbiconiux aconitum]MCS5718033.1 HAD family hydrolase [Herbiconiux aconitum]
MAHSSALRAALFDIDGTLIDSNYLHVDAWTRAFDDVGVAVDAWRVHRAIALDSSKLLEALLGDRADELGDRAKERHAAHYEKLHPRLRRFDGARDLIARLSEAGVRVVLATSAPPEEFEALRACLDVDDFLHAATTADDVTTAKPDPDIIGVALERAGVSASEAVMIGDTRWDAEAAGRAGVRSLGVLSGGIAAAELRDGGAAEVFDDVSAILATVADAGPARLAGSE